MSKPTDRSERPPFTIDVADTNEQREACFDVRVEGKLEEHTLYDGLR